MHEFGMVEELIHKLVKQLGKRVKSPIGSLRLRHGPGLSESSIQQAFQVQSRGTPLEKARLELEHKIVTITCECGDSVWLNSGDHHVPYAICRECHKVHAIPGFNLLEVIDVG